MEVASGKREELKIFGADYSTRDGTGVRDYIHVSDLADAHVKALLFIVKNKKSLLVNLGSEQGISVKEMLEATSKISGKQISSKVVGRRAGDPATLYASSEKAHKILDWKAKYSDVETIVKTTWDVYNR